MLDINKSRERMVSRQIIRRGVSNPDVIGAMRVVPREAFVPERLREFAYEDTPLPIEAGQTISQPFIVAAMIEAGEVKPGETVLEIGAGSGYAAAVISRIAAQVFAIERHENLATLARARMRALGYANVQIRTGDGTRGWAEAAPFDAIIASAGAPAIPQTLKDQLGMGGVLVMPVGETPREQRLIKVRRQSATLFEEEDLGAVSFVPMIGEHGWGCEEETHNLLARPTRDLVSPNNSPPRTGSTKPAR